MTLASEIAALTGDEDAATLRAIDARVLTLLCPSATIGHYTADDDGYVVFHARDIGVPDKSDLPYYTTSLDATHAEIKRRGFYYQSGNICENDKEAWFKLWMNGFDYAAEVERTDDNLALAALEALVRAVEGGADIGTTARYAHADRDDQRAAMEKVERRK